MPHTEHQPGLEVPKFNPGTINLLTFLTDYRRQQIRLAANIALDAASRQHPEIFEELGQPYLFTDIKDPRYESATVTAQEAGVTDWDIAYSPPTRPKRSAPTTESGHLTTFATKGVVVVHWFTNDVAEGDVIEQQHWPRPETRHESAQKTATAFDALARIMSDPLADVRPIR